MVNIKECKKTVKDVYLDELYLQKDTDRILYDSHRMRFDKSILHKREDITSYDRQPSLLHDKMFKAMFPNSHRISYSAKLLSYLVDQNFDTIKRGLKLYKTEFDKTTMDTKEEIGDYVAKYKNTFINIESNNKSNLRRNLDYMDRLSMIDIKRGQPYKYYSVIQVNLNNFYREGKGIYEVNHRTTDDGELVVYKVSLDIHIPLVYEKMYTEGIKNLSELERYLIVLTTTDRKLAILLAKGDRIMEEYVKEANVVKLRNPDLFEAFDHVQDMIDGAVLQTEEKYEKRLETQKFDTAKKLFKNGLSLEMITKCLEFTSNELEKFKLML